MKQINRSRWRQILDKILQGDLSQLKQIGRSIRERKNTLKIVAIIAVIILVVAPIYSVISEFVTQNTLYRNKTPNKDRMAESSHGDGASRSWSINKRI